MGVILNDIDDPLELFSAAASAVEREDWLALALLCDRDSLQRFVNELLRPFRGTDPAVELSVEDYVVHTGVTREVAENEIARIREQQSPESRLRDQFPRINSVAALLRLTPPEVFAAWLHGCSPRAQIDRQLQQGLVTPEVAVHAIARIRGVWRYRALGSVSDGADLRHVVYLWEGNVVGDTDNRTEVGAELVADDHREHPQILTLRRSGSGYGILANERVFGIGIHMYHFEPHGEGEA
jgi:hypothetical protein